MNAQFTPGPWEFGEWEQFGDTRFYVSQKEGAPYTPNYSDVCSLIAETVSGERVKIQRANARLIASAPEMAAAIAETLDTMSNGSEADMKERLAASYKLLLAAYTKAVGDPA